MGSKVVSSQVCTVGLLVLCTILFFWHLDAYSLFNETEAKQAEIARQIWVRQDWLTPYYNGEAYFDKPILLHWLMALAIPLVGVNEWAVRLPSAIAATALILTTWAFVRHIRGDRVALLTSTFLAANPFTLTLGRTGQHDMLLTSFLAIALYSWFMGYATGQTWGYLGFFGAIALATLAKGPLAIVLSGLTLVGFIAWIGRWSIFWRMPWLKGGLIFGAIVLPWYGLVIRVNGWTFVEQFLGYNHVDRFLRPNLQQSAPAYFYIALFAIGLFPWNGLLPSVLLERLRWQYLQPAFWRRTNPKDQLIPFMVIWLVGVAGFMSAAATKLPWYVFPGVPALAYLCALSWEAYLCAPRRTLSWQLWGIAGLYLMGAALVVWIPQEFGDVEIIQAISATGVLSFWVSVTVGTALIVGLGAYWHQVVWSCWGCAISFILIALSVVNPFMPVLDRTALAAEIQPIVEALQQEVEEKGSEVLPVALKLKAPTLNFYSRIDVIKRVEFREGFLTLRRDHPERILLITEQKTLRELNLMLPDAVLIEKANDYVLLELPPAK